MTDEKKPPRTHPLDIWDQDQTLTKEEVMAARARDLWHQTRVVVIVASSRSRLGRPMGGMTEAHCTCGWSESCKNYEEACRAADGHVLDQARGENE